MDSPPEDLKYISHYLQRASELRAKDPVVAYYCNYYAAKLAINKGPKNKETNAYLYKLLNLLEQVPILFYLFFMLSIHRNSNTLFIY